jgi:NADH-quinone oxidoreductase subunit E
MEDNIREIIKKNGSSKTNILSMLIELQYNSEHGYIDKKTAGIVAEELGMTEAKIYEIITFYAMLKTKPQAKHVLKICNSSPCHFTKSENIKNFLEKELDVQMGNTSSDGMFAFHYIPCVGACNIGPVIKVEDTVYGNLDEASIKALLNDLRNGKTDQ